MSDDSYRVDIEKVIGGRKFLCGRVSFKETVEGDPGAPARRVSKVTAWGASPDAGPIGLVAVDVEETVNGKPRKVHGELVGFGTATETTWGSK